jgi:ribulose-phosphate 3-epimerase
MKAGISLNPDTPIEKILPLIPCTDLVLIMSVFPGFEGQSFIPTVLDKVQKLNHHPLRKNFLIEIDGGINKETIQKAAESGVDIFVAGSAVFKSNDSVQAIQELKILCNRVKE